MKEPGLPQCRGSKGRRNSEQADKKTEAQVLGRGCQVGGGGQPVAGVKICCREQVGIPTRKKHGTSAEAKFSQGGWRGRQQAFGL